MIQADKIICMRLLFAEGRAHNFFDIKFYAWERCIPLPQLVKHTKSHRISIEAQSADWTKEHIEFGLGTIQNGNAGVTLTSSIIYKKTI